MSTLTQGRIVWAVVPDPQGRNEKERPLVILSEKPAELAENDDVLVVAVTTQTGQAPAAHSVSLPWSQQSNCITKLREPSAAVCTWLCKIKRASIVKVGGLVPPAHVKKILDTVAELARTDA